MKKINNFINKNIINFIIILLFIQPIVDVITATSLKFNLNILLLGSIIKFLFLGILTYYSLLISIHKYKKYLLIYLFLVIIYFIFYILNLSTGNFFEVSSFLKVCYFPMLLINLFIIYINKKENVKDINLIKMAYIYIFIIVIASITKTSFDSYQISKTGSVGWFNSANEVGAIIALIIPLIYNYIFTNFNYKKIFVLVLTIISVFIIGTKIPLFSLLLTSFVYIIKYFVYLTKNKLFKKLTIIIISFLVLGITSLVILPKTPIYKNTIIHLNYLDIHNVKDLFKDKNTIDHFFFGQRLSFLEEVSTIYDSSNLNTKLLGLGYKNPVKMIEMDMFEIYYRNGIIGFILFIIVPLALIVISFKKLYNRYLLPIIIALITSFLAGHVLVSPSVSLVLTIIIVAWVTNDSGRKTILISSYNLDYGGIEASLINLLNNFDYQKYKVVLFLEEKKGVFLDTVNTNVIIKEYKVNTNNNFIIRKIINLFKRLIFIITSSQQYDASICYASYSLPGTFMTKIASNNSIYFIHSNYYEVYNHDISQIKEFFDKRKITKFNHIIFVSNEAKKDLIKIYPNITSKSLVINNLINYDSIISKANELIDYKYDSKKINLVFVGRIEERSKKITRLIETMILLKDELIHLTIVGDGEDKKGCEQLVKDNKLTNINFVGAQKNPYPYIKNASYFILTSDYEGFPAVYNEAIILNKPIITTIDVTDDYISIPSRFGIITLKDPVDISTKIKKIINKPFIIKEKVNYQKLNKQRIEKLVKLIEGE